MLLFNSKALLSQWKPRDVAENFDTYRNLQPHRAVLPAIARHRRVSQSVISSISKTAWEVTAGRIKVDQKCSSSMTSTSLRHRHSTSRDSGPVGYGMSATHHCPRRRQYRWNLSRLLTSFSFLLTSADDKFTEIYLSIFRYCTKPLSWVLSFIAVAAHECREQNNESE